MLKIILNIIEEQLESNQNFDCLIPPKAQIAQKYNELIDYLCKMNAWTDSDIKLFDSFSKMIQKLEIDNSSL